MQLRTTRQAKIRGHAVEGFPLILNDQYEVDWLSLEHFLDLHRSVGVTSIRLYASHLVDFLSQLEVDEISIDDVTDDWLVAYKRSLLERKNGSGVRNSGNYGSQVLRTVVNYLYWLEQEKYIRGVVGATKHHRVRVESSSRGIKHPLTKNKSNTRKRTVTPRKEWIDAVKVYGPGREDLAVRFELMIDWGVSAGLRAMEICALRIDTLPSRETAEKALADGKNIYVNLPKTKGDKQANIPVSPLLVIRTWDYINLYRTDVLELFKKKAKKNYQAYSEPNEIFLSSKTGEAVTKRALSNSIRSAFLRAVEEGDLTIDEKVWTHGLRHNFTTNLLKGLDAKGVMRPEAIARQVTRHAHPDSLAPYATDRYNEDFHG